MLYKNYEISVRIVPNPVKLGATSHAKHVYQAFALVDDHWTVQLGYIPIEYSPAKARAIASRRLPDVLRTGY